MMMTRAHSSTADLSFTPLDVGFDLRLHDICVLLPYQFRSVAIDIDGQTIVVRGTREQMIEAMRKAGYRITQPNEHAERGTP